jgi:type IX secretion system PorP/SprF family membrane protein
MKKIILAITALVSLHAGAQQIALNSQYMYNELLINPAVAGNKPYTPIGFAFRRQWAGIDAAPVTQSLFGHGYLGGGFGLGGMIYNDVAGPSRRTGASLSMAYHFRLNDKMNLSFGLGGNVTQFYIDRDELVTEIQGDQAVIMNTNNQLVPDANAGLWLYTERLFVGVSAFQLIQSRVDLFDIQKNIENTLNRTMYFTGGYAIPVSEKFEIIPSTLFRFMLDAPFALDVNAMFSYDKKYWLGGSFRLNDAVAVMAGFSVGQFNFGYAYDITLSDLKTYSNGSHEIYFGVHLKSNDNNKAPWKKRNRVYSSYTKSYSFD